MSHVIRDLAATLPVPEAGIASSPLLDLAGSTKLVLFAMDAGQEISPHAAPFPARVTVLQGRLEVMAGETWHALGDHGALDLPANLPHAVRALAPSHFLLTMLRGAKAAPAEPAAPARDEASYGVDSPVLRHWMRQHDEALRRLALMERGARAGDWKAVKAVAVWLYEELKTHNEAEEQFLFPLMDPHFGGGHGPTDCMRSEHRALWSATLELQAALQDGPPADPARAATLALGIAADLGAHIDKENQVLYPMAERLLTPEDLRGLERAYAAAQ